MSKLLISRRKLLVGAAAGLGATIIVPKRGLAWLAQAPASAGGGTFSLITHSYGQGMSNPITTAAVNTTGANLIVVHVSQFYPDAGTTLSDSKSNSWTPLTIRIDGGGNVSSQLFYCYAPTVGSGHTFSWNGTNGGIFMEAFGGNTTPSPFDQQNGAAVSGSSLQPGSVTPGVNGEVIVTGVNAGASSGQFIDSGFTITDQFPFTPEDCAAMAYLIQTTAGAVNPTWTFTPTPAAATIATFKP